MNRNFKDNRQPDKIVQARRDKALREIDVVFDDYVKWIEETMTSEDNPYIQIIAVLKGSS